MQGVCVDGDGNVIIADLDNHRVRMMTPHGVMTTLAGTGTAGRSVGRVGVGRVSWPAGADMPRSKCGVRSLFLGRRRVVATVCVCVGELHLCCFVSKPRQMCTCAKLAWPAVFDPVQPRQRE